MMNMTAIQENWFDDAITGLAERTGEPRCTAIRKYAHWRRAPTYEAGTFDEVMRDVPVDGWQDIVDAVNGLYADAFDR